ncbi:MAG: hypothetical protein FJX02_08175 [Alphaproteobacteria bacterium]|nr:hypothetical protein [Alphaproteobacteria bacterium]
MAKPIVDSRREAELRALIAAGDKLGAIKLHRELTGAGLKESKETVEAMLEGKPAGGAGAVQAASGRATMILVVVLVAALVVAALALVAG